MSQTEFFPIGHPPPGGVPGLGCSPGIESRPLAGYECVGFGGGCLGISQEERDLKRFGRNIVALKENSGRWRICTELEFRGECEDIGASLPALPPRFAGRIRSIKPIWAEPAGRDGTAVLGRRARALATTRAVSGR